MKRKFRVTRSIHGHCENVVEAENHDEAMEIALQLPVENIIVEAVRWRESETIDDDNE